MNISRVLILYAVAALCLLAWLVISLKKAGSFVGLARGLGGWVAAGAVIIVLLATFVYGVMSLLLFASSHHPRHAASLVICVTVFVAARAWLLRPSPPGTGFPKLPPLTRPADLAAQDDASWTEMKPDEMPRPARGRSWEEKH